MRTWIEINQKNIKNNYKAFKSLIDSNCLLMAVVKSNAYGHNLVEFSHIVEKLGVDWLGVDSIVEAETLRKKKIKKPMLVLGYTVNDKIKSAISNNISLTVSDFYTLKSLNKINFDLNKKLKIHIKIDTGMHRQGFLVSEIPKLIKILKKRKSFIKIEGIYTHFASSKNPLFLKETLNQLKKFNKSIEIFERAGFKNLIKHASSTSATLTFPQSHFDMVRIGIGMYGIWPSKETKNFYENKINLKPVLSWKTIVGQIKKIPKGSRIGYDFTEKLNRDSKVAILPIGYWHGFRRSFSSIGNVVICNKKAKVLGRVSMDMITVDVTEIKNVKIKDTVTIIGKTKSMEITADDLANLANTTSYEIVTCLNPKIKRITK